MFAYPPQSEADIAYRQEILDSWIATANGQDSTIEDRGDYYRVGNTVYVRTGAAMRQAFGVIATNRHDRQILRVEE